MGKKRTTSRVTKESILIDLAVMALQVAGCLRVAEFVGCAPKAWIREDDGTTSLDPNGPPQRYKETLGSLHLYLQDMAERLDVWTSTMFQALDADEVTSNIASDIWGDIFQAYDFTSPDRLSPSEKSSGSTAIDDGESSGPSWDELANGLESNALLLIAVSRGIKGTVVVKNAIVVKNRKDKRFLRRAQALSIKAEHPDWTQNQVADAMNLNPGQLSRILNPPSKKDRQPVPTALTVDEHYELLENDIKRNGSRNPRKK